MTQFWASTAKAEEISGTRMSKRIVGSIGTTFYPKAFSCDEEMQHALNRIITLKESILGDWVVEKDNENEITNRQFRLWFRNQWFKWEVGNEVLKENIADQMYKQLSDSLSRRSVDGAFLKEVNASRKFIERKKDDKIGDMMMQK